MRKVEIIRARLEKALSPLQLKILDESAHHAGHAGATPEGETHFNVEIVSKQFEGLNRVARHRLVYAALDGAFSEGLHALAVHTKAPGE
jgi:BolA protein